MSKAVFITGTGTDMGKTYLSGLIVKKLAQAGKNPAYYKAAMSGNDRRTDGSLIPGDALFVREMSGISQSLDDMCPYIYENAWSPHLASRVEGNPVATVSMVLNKKYNVSFSRETVEKVEQAARELGYHLPGRKNRKESRKEKLIVVFCPTLTSPYYVLLLQGIEAVANKQGYGVFICNTQRDPRLEEKYLRMMGTIEPLGIIYCCNPNPDFQQQVEELAQTIPLVIISNKEKTTTIDAINQDNTVVGRMMARHLLDLGHRDVAFITPPLTRRQWQRTKRVNGFVKEFEKEGLKDHVIIKAADEAIDMQIPRMDSEYSMGYELTMELLDEGREFTAIAGQNDMMAIGALDALHEARIHVPKDVSVIGCDNIFYSGIRKISLTTIDHFVALKGRDACDIILRKIDEQDRFLTDSAPVSLYNIEYTPKLIARRTTGYVRTKKNN